MLYKELQAEAFEIDAKAPNHCFDTCDFLQKTAGEAVKYFNDLTAKKDHLYFLVVAMTAGEFYSSNKNGDYFKEEDLKRYYKSFETAGVFWNHDNKDATKSFGSVMKAFYNDAMHRIELVIEVPTDKARYLKDYIEQGKPISVSMGLKTPCFIAGTHVRKEDGSLKPIEDFEKREMVITSDGNIKEVEKVTITDYIGDVIEVQPRVGNKLVNTPAHKYHVIDFRKLGYNTKALRFRDIVELIGKSAKDIKTLKEWVPADELDPDRHILTQASRIENIEFEDRIDEGTARILGYYLAEGHIIKKSSRKGTKVTNIGICLSCHVDDNLLKEIYSLCESANITITNIATYKSNTSEFVRMVYIYSHELAKLALEYCGQYAKEKKLSRNIFLWPDNFKKHFIGAYADGDGHFSVSSSHYGHLSLSTASKGLSEQLKYLLDSLGIQSSSGRLNHKPSGKAKHCTIEYTSVMSKYAAQNFLGYCSKVFKIKLGKSSSVRKKFIDGTGLVLLKGIKRYPFAGKVYDLVVKDDHSFVAEDINVHNSESCSICGHVTKGSYTNRCEHLKFMMNTVLHDGRKVFAVSGVPLKVFDISFVFRPADRIGYAMLTKSASISGNGLKGLSNGKQ